MNKISVYDGSLKTPKKLGDLIVDQTLNVDRFSFIYDTNLTTRELKLLSIDSELSSSLDIKTSRRANFGLFDDSCPTSWGRKTISQYYKTNNNTVPREFDILLSCNDDTRMGAIRYSFDEGQTFVSSNFSNNNYSISNIKNLESLSQKLQLENLNEKNELNTFYDASSSLGGARPKSTVIDENGDYWVAKFFSINDNFDYCAWEKVVHDLARLCKFKVPESKLIRTQKGKSIFLVKRFDRINGKRIHMASALTALNKTEEENQVDHNSYLEIANLISKNSTQKEIDLKELFKRIIFNIVVSNTDDHLRNHSFVFEDNGWHLSTLYDVTVIPDSNNLNLKIDYLSNLRSIPLAISTASNYGISNEEAIEIANEIINIVNNNLETLAYKYEISSDEYNSMKHNFYNYR